MKIPNLTHFVFGLREQSEPFHLVHYLCLESCRRVLQPDAIYLHHKHRPYGPYWELIEPHLTLVEADLAPEVLEAEYNETLVPQQYRYAHHADFVRLDALIEHGGIYADIDTLFVRPFEPAWFKHPFVIAREDPVRDELTGEVKPSLCNALLLSEARSEFAETWRREMASALNGTWSNHSNFLAQELSVRLPDAAHILPQSAFFKFGATEDGIDAIFGRLETEVDEVFSIHLWSHLWWSEARRDFSDVSAATITEEYVREVDTTYNVLARAFLPPPAQAARQSSKALRLDYLGLDEPSGYGVAAARAVAALREVDAAVSWRPFKRDMSWGLGYAPVTNAFDQSSEAVIAHLTPEYYPLVREIYPRSPLVGHTVWETDRLPAHWPDLLELPDLLVVPCEWNADVIRAGGVSTPIAVVPHVASAPPRQPQPDLTEADRETFVFYTIGAWTARKALWNAVRAYLGAFTRDDPVVLIIKTGSRDHTVVDPPTADNTHHGTTSWALARLLGEFPKPARIELITRDMSDAEIWELHRRGDCYISLCRSEGWGLTAFDAASVATPVMITGYGGHLDYLDDDTADLLRYDLVPVEDSAGAGSYTPDQNWAEPRIDDAIELLAQTLARPDPARERARAAQRRIHDRYSPTRIGESFLSAIEPLTGRRRRQRIRLPRARFRRAR
ncbi:MAG: glycosyltransferase [Gaiellaceae bacterium]